MKFVYTKRVIPFNAHAFFHAQFDVDVTVNRRLPKFVAKLVGIWTALAEAEVVAIRAGHGYEHTDTVVTQAVNRHTMVRCTFVRPGGTA